MGFKLGRVYVLDFEGIDAMNGAIVKLRSPSIDVTDSLPGMSAIDTWKVMLEHLVEWNLETPAGEPLPHTIEAITGTMEPGVAQLICREWYRVARGLSAPLERRSEPGEPSPEEENPEPSMPMETL